MVDRDGFENWNRRETQRNAMNVDSVFIGETKFHESPVSLTGVEKWGQNWSTKFPFLFLRDAGRGVT